MTEFLLFQLYGPMAAWGDVAVGQMRPALSAPSRSAVFGLVEAALGILRDDEERIMRIERGYGFAVKVESQGNLMVDFHSIQPPRAVALKKWPAVTRREEVIALHNDASEGNTQENTMLSFREYRLDASAVVALWAKDENQHLADIAEAIKKPHFSLYLGRKSAPPALPMAPVILSKQTLKEAFDSYREEIPLCEEIDTNITMTIHGDELEEKGYEVFESVIRRDRVRSRKRWQFDERSVWIALEKQEG